MIDTHVNSSSGTVLIGGFTLPNSSFMRRVSLLSRGISPLEITAGEYLAEICKSDCRATLPRPPKTRTLSDSGEGRLAIEVRRGGTSRDHTNDSIRLFREGVDLQFILLNHAWVGRDSEVSSHWHPIPPSQGRMATHSRRLPVPGPGPGHGL